jgi:hypothetical protein
MSKDLLKRLSKMEKQMQFSNFKPIVFIKPGESPGIIGPNTIVIIDDISEDE